MALIITQVETEWNLTDKEIIDAALDKCALRWSDSLDSNVYNTVIRPEQAFDKKRSSNVYVNLSNPEYEQVVADKYPFVTRVDEELPLTLPHNTRKAKIYIAGFGPAGMFAALLLAENGYNPVVIERGDEIDKRTDNFTDYLTSALPSEIGAVKYGEGGGRLFTDNTLYTKTGDPFMNYVLRQMVKFGAPKSIMTESRPRINAETMRRVIKGIRYNIIDCGGTVRFNTKLTGVNVADGRIRSVILNGNTEERCDKLILACGQNASDVYGILLDAGVKMLPRPYFAGIRIEHLRDDVDNAIYGDLNASDKTNLPPAVYTLISKIDGRDVFTYRVMGGGCVMPAQVNDSTCIVEGAMPEKALSKVTTSAICVSVQPSDYGGSESNPLAGIEFRRNIEQNARLIAKYGRVPATTVKGFLEGRADAVTLPDYSTYPFGVTLNDFTKIFPPFMISALKKGLVDFSKKLLCFNDPQAVLTAPESRIIPPVKIVRDEDNLTASGVDNIFISGECAGYTEGVMNAAFEGIKAAIAVASR
jgi:uncharacterized FAD-dependent dehydrogenase